MIKEILGIVEKIDAKPFLICFVALSLGVTFHEDYLEPLNRISQFFAFLIFSLFSFVAVLSWKGGIYRLNSILPPGDLMNFGVLIGCAILAFTLFNTFQYLSHFPEVLSLEFLRSPDFIYGCTMYFLAAETIKIKK